jgi:tetratricopeptide (TPR) repeat protein/O-antigen ligase
MCKLVEIAEPPEKDNSVLRVNWTFVLQSTWALILFAYLLFIGGRGDKIANIRAVYISNLVLFTLMYGVLFCYPLITGTRLPRPSYNLFIQAFLGVTLLSVIFSINFWQSIHEYYLWGFYYFLLFGIVCIVSWGWKKVHLLNCLLIIGGLHNLIKIFFAIKWMLAWWGNPYQGISAILVYRTSSPNQTATIAYMILIVALAGLFEIKKNIKSYSYLFLIISSSCVIILSSSRGGMIATVVGCGTILLVHGFQHTERFFAIIKRYKIPLVIISSGAIILFGGRFYQLLNSGRSGIEGRFDFWNVAIKTFVTNPVLGSGLYTMSVHLFGIQSIPPESWFTHAHNIFLNILGELGIVGLITFVICLVICIKFLFQKYQNDRDLIALGTLGICSAFIFHGLFDTVIVEPYVAIFLTIFCGIALAPSKNRRFPTIAVKESPSIWLTGIIVCLGWVLFYQRIPIDKAVLVESDNTQASIYVETAIDRKPRWAFGYQQYAFLQSILAEEDVSHEQDYIDTAIQYYDKAIEFDPDWATNYANLSVLYASNGNYDRAIESMEKAINLAPKAALFHLNLAIIAEEAGRDQMAISHYWEFLMFQDDWDLGPFWQSTTVRRLVYDQVMKSKLIEIEPEKPVEEYIHAIKKGKFNCGNYLRLADRYYDLGKYQLAKDILRYAEMGPPESSKQYLEILWLKAKISVAEGNVVDGLKFAQAAFNGWRFQSSEGPGRFSSSKYGERLFRSPELRSGLVPQFAVYPLPSKWVDNLVTAGKWYLLVGEEKNAEEIFLEVLEYDGKNQEAGLLLSEIRNK